VLEFHLECTGIRNGGNFKFLCLYHHWASPWSANSLQNPIHSRSKSRISTHPKSNLIGKSKPGEVPRQKSPNSAEEIPVQKRKIQVKFQEEKSKF
jgi:hypothetical protein